MFSKAILPSFWEYSRYEESPPIKRQRPSDGPNSAHFDEQYSFTCCSCPRAHGRGQQLSTFLLKAYLGLLQRLYRAPLRSAALPCATCSKTTTRTAISQVSA